MAQEEREKKGLEEGKFEILRPFATGDGYFVRIKVGDQWRLGAVILTEEGGVMEMDITPRSVVPSRSGEQPK